MAMHHLRSVTGRGIIAGSLCCMCTFGATFYVSTEGSDENPGSEGAPFLSVQRAQKAVRTLKANQPFQNPVDVILRQGSYRLSEPLLFAPADSGTETCPITYRAASGEEVVVSGGVLLTAPQVTDGRWLFDVPAPKDGTEWTFTQLYVNGQRRPRARMPDEGHYFRVLSAFTDKHESRRGFHYARKDIPPGTDLTRAIFNVYGSWYNTIHHVQNVDPDTCAVFFTNQAGRPFSWYEKNLRYYIENIPEALDHPGEWYFDPKVRVLTYLPLPGETPENTPVVAPRVAQTLIRLQGDSGSGLYVEHLHFKGLEFRHTDAYLPPDLYDARQAATVQDAGFLADGARNCSITECEVANMGEHGIWFRDDCHGNRVEKCHVHDLGGGGIYVGEKWRWGNDCPGWKGYKNIADIPHTTEHNTVDNCLIHDGCHIFTGSIGIWIGQASHTTVSHNEICDLSYSGISVGWDWSGHESTCHDNRIEFNHIHHIGHGRMNDMAGIYTLGVSNRTVIDNNLIHDVQAYQSPVGYCLGAGIYLDQSSGELTISNNVCYNLSNAGFFLHYGTNNRILNNIFADIHALGRIGWGMNFCARKGKGDNGNVAEGNIVYRCNGKAAKAYLSKGNETENEQFITINRNLYWCPDSETLSFSLHHDNATNPSVDMEKWQEAGYDSNGQCAVPAFLAPQDHDYRLAADSPARKMGIKSIEVSGVGLYGDGAWKAQCQGVSLRPCDLPTPLEKCVLLSLREDYESNPPGFVPPNVNFTDKQKGAVVEVTDAVAASGKQSLKFVDVPGLPQSYYPNRTWRNIHVSKGMVTVKFDVMNSLEQPATIWFEMRDWQNTPYAVGPSITAHPDSVLEVNGKNLGTVTPGTWHHVEIRLLLSESPAKAYELTLGPCGETATTHTIEFDGDGLDALTWIGFVAVDQDRHAQFYIDNLYIETQ